MAETKAKKQSFKEKASKAYGSINKGLSKLDEWYWGKPKKKTSTKKKRKTAKKPAETPRGTKIVIYVNGPAPAPARTQTKKTTRRK